MSEVLHTKFGNARLNHGYYRITSRKEGNHGKMLHRLIFEDFYQCNLDEMFPNYDIHHVDGDKTHNEIWNMDLIPRGEHQSIHLTNRPCSAETRKKLSDWRTGKFHSEETRKKMSESSKGIIYPLETKIAQSKHRNTTGIFRLSKVKNKNVPQGFRWVYGYYVDGKRKVLSNNSLSELKKRILAKGLDWIILDEDLAAKTMQEM